MLAPAFSSHPSGKREELSPPWAHLPSAAQQLGMGIQAQGSQTARCKVWHSRATASMGPPQPSKEDTCQARPTSTQGTEAIPGAGQRTASCDTPLARMEGRAPHWCLEKPDSACAPSYQPSPGQTTGRRWKGSSPTPCPLGAPSTDRDLRPLPRAGGGATLPELYGLCRPHGELGRAIRLGRAPQTGDSISRHGKTPHPGSLTGSDGLRASGSQRLPHCHHAGGAPGWHNPSQGSWETSSLTGAPVSCSLHGVLQVSTADAHASPLPMARHLPAAPRCTYRPSLEAGARCRLPAAGFLACPLSVALAAAPAPTRFNPPSEQAGHRGERHQESRDWRGGHIPAPGLPLPPGIGGLCQARRSPVPARKAHGSRAGGGCRARGQVGWWQGLFLLAPTPSGTSEPPWHPHERQPPGVSQEAVKDLPGVDRRPCGQLAAGLPAGGRRGLRAGAGAP